MCGGDGGVGGVGGGGGGGLMANTTARGSHPAVQGMQSVGQGAHAHHGRHTGFKIGAAVVDNLVPTPISHVLKLRHGRHLHTHAHSTKTPTPRADAIPPPPVPLSRLPAGLRGFGPSGCKQAFAASSRVLRAPTPHKHRGSNPRWLPAARHPRAAHLGRPYSHGPCTRQGHWRTGGARGPLPPAPATPGRSTDGGKDGTHKPRGPSTASAPPPPTSGCPARPEAHPAGQTRPDQLH